MDRRSFLTAAGATVSVSFAGCAGLGGNDEANTGASSTDESTASGTSTGDAGGAGETLVVGTYSAFVDSPSTSPGAWVKQRFEEEFDARLIWQTPSNEVNHYIERRNAGVDIEADMYLGLNTDHLVRVDENLDDGLFADVGDVAGQDDIKPGLQFDPDGRAIPYDTGYISLVFDGTSTTAPETFDGLLAEEHAGDLITQNPASSATGRAFLLHTVKQFGPDGYLDYWSDLQDNDVRVLGSWSDAYSAWSGGEAPMVVSYSTDQVFADQNDANMEKHQIRFLNDQGYANPEGMAVFDGADTPDLAREFMSFLLRPEIQGEIAVRNVQFPATESADLPEDYAKLAQEPPEPVTFGYDELKGSVSGWISDWERQFASN
ncbi:thiamine ABC transporter substrate-binding protein [Haloarcula argentinensis]|uniref:Thiamine ABC transporter substrate-binding protein n=1 Tax=Haloarcula argentinensis TaxID=43776 RepID=A0A847URG3_HALAR|nr:thiamine ABC transporter substrate-binding protein [Haloarcula argentinensis]NLV14804.1 thiamine ABC transporter substrate-binding protein [Haloarcula argentinensis]